MFNIKDLLVRIQGARTQDSAIKGLVGAVLEEIAGIKVAEEDISYENGLVTVKNLDAASKSALFIKKLRVLQRLKEKSGEFPIVDIR